VKRYLTLVSFTTSALAGSSVARAATVKTASSPLGRILVDSRGRTLYLFEKDKRGRSACAGACASYSAAADRLGYGRSVRAAIDTALQLTDQDTADLFIEVSRAIDKHLWLVEAHAQS
jgi:hypothetical protein